MEKRNENEVLTMILNEEKNILSHNGEEFTLEKGIVFKGNYYNFRLITNKGENKSDNQYSTSARIYGIQLVGDNLNVFEDVKSFPWKFDAKTGVLLQCAAYSKSQSEAIKVFTESADRHQESDEVYSRKTR